MKRWVVTLCVALMAFCALGHSHRVTAQTSDIAAYAQSASQQSDGDHDFQGGADHCCCAHVTVAPSASTTCTFVEHSEDPQIPHSDRYAPTRDPTSLERPPRMIIAA